MTVFINDQPHTLGAGTTLAELLRGLGLGERKGLAIAINDEVVSRSQWSSRLLAEGERVLLIHATQGG